MLGSPQETLTTFRRALEGILGIPATEGNELTVLRNGDRIFPAMLDAIRSATSAVDFLTFVYWDGDIGREVAQALVERAAAGVRVRVLLDHLGSCTMDKELVSEMRRAGAQVEWFRPVSRRRPWHAGHWNHRTHRKVLVCDEEVAFTGGVGIADEWRGDARGPSEWRDTHVRVRGPAVDGLRAAFVQNWAEAGGTLLDAGVDRFPCQPVSGSSVVQVVRGASQTGWSDVNTLVRALLSMAEERVRVATAYFVPDEDTCRFLCSTARRGVEIEVMVPGRHADKRFVQLASEGRYQALLDAGVRIHAFQTSMLHAKVVTVDGVVATVGSANLTARGMLLDDEVNLVAFDPRVARALDDDFERDLESCDEISAAYWSGRGPLQRAKEGIAGLGRPWM